MATLTISSPYKSGTLSSLGTGANGANTRLNTSGVTWAAGDVGRHVYFTNGNARWESRKIIAQGANYCDIEFAFGTFPLRDQDGNDTLSNAPSSGNTLGVSYTLDEIDNGVSLVKESAQIFRMPSGEGLAIGASVMVYDTEKVLSIDSNYVDLDGILQLGDMTAQGFVVGACSLVDYSVAINGGFGFISNQVDDADDVGALRLYGGAIISTTTCFWRLYSDSTAGMSHIVDTMVTGDFGMRMGSNAKSILYKPSFTKNTLFAGPFTTKTPVGLLSQISVNDSANVMFWGVSFGGDSTAQNIRFDPESINTGFLLLAGVTGGPYDLLLRDVPITDIETLESNSVPFATLSGTITSTGHTIEVQNALTLTIADSGGTYQDDWRCRLTNAEGTQLLNALSVDGFWNQTWAKYADIAVNADGQFPMDFSDLTTYGPYSYRLRKYGFAEINSAWDGKSTVQVDWREPASAPVVANEATAGSYTGIAVDGSAETITVSSNHTLQEVYDYCNWWAAQSANIQYDMPMSTSDGTNFALLSSWTFTVSNGATLSGVGQTLSLPSGSVIDGAVTCNIVLAGTTAQADDIENFGGSLTLTGAAVLAIDGGAGGAFPAGASGAGAKFVISESGDNTYDATEYDFDGSTDIEITSGDDITVSLGTGQTEPNAVETSGTITFSAPIVTVTGEVAVTQAGSRIQVYNETTDTEIANEVLAGTTWSIQQVFGSGSNWSPGDTIRVRASYQNGLSATAKATTSFAVGASENWAVTLTQETCPTYTAYGIDGSTVTEFSWDGANVQFDVNDPDNLWYVSRLFAWDKHHTFTEVGIRESFKYISAIDAGNIQIDNEAALDNLKAQTAMQADQVRLFRPNGTLPVANPTTGGGGFTFYSTGTVFVTETGVSGLTSGESATLNKLNGVIDANVSRVNGVPVTGSGTEIDPWGP
jgi:hypothetical protein